nr:hypothetical protein [uncultured bacterium]
MARTSFLAVLGVTAALLVPGVPAQAAPVWSPMPHPATGTVRTLVAYSTTSAFATTIESCRCEENYDIQRVWRLVGETWSHFPVPTDLLPGTITGTSGTDTWFFGPLVRPDELGSRAFHWDGQRWTEHALGIRGFRIADATTLATNDIWVSGSYNPGYDRREDQAAVGHWNGSSWTVTVLPRPTGTTTALSAIHGRTAADVWAAGDVCTPFETGNARCQAFVMRWNGTGWTRVTVPSSSPRSALPTAVVVGAGEVWFAARETDLTTRVEPDRVYAMRWHGTGWTRTYLPDGTDDGLYTNVTSLAYHSTGLLAGLTNTANEGVVRFTGQTWEAVPGPATRTPTVTDLARLPSGEVLASGRATNPFLARLSSS